MQRCLQLAQLGAGNVAPNPVVGAVLVHNDSIIGEGYHRQYGQAHAEVNCINNVAEQNRRLINESTLYVSLEPCAHYGKTPPCADLIIQTGIPKVVIGCRDSYKEVNGRGIDKLQAAGIEVITGILEQSARKINKRFFTFHEQGRPYIILKWAESSDHAIANADHSRVIISNGYTNRLVHKWRAEEAAIMVGTNTALYDDPSLTNRHWYGHHPVRIMIDKELQVPSSHHLTGDEHATIIFNTVKAGDAGNKLYRKITTRGSALDEMLRALYEMKIQSVLVEGGAQLLQSFIDTGCWDEARVITNEKLVIGNGIASPVLKEHAFLLKETIFSDTISYYGKR
jgi:diaminohydroxyphosphoribosylaminopyrimidine deaminase / 5-amino-6-(5-phosphoribosylamino)uracil reductase